MSAKCIITPKETTGNHVLFTYYVTIYIIFLYYCNVDMMFIDLFTNAKTLHLETLIR